MMICYNGSSFAIGELGNLFSNMRYTAMFNGGLFNAPTVIPLQIRKIQDSMGYGGKNVSLSKTLILFVNKHLFLLFRWMTKIFQDCGLGLNLHVSHKSTFISEGFLFLSSVMTVWCCLYMSGEVLGLVLVFPWFSWFGLLVLCSLWSFLLLLTLLPAWLCWSTLSVCLFLVEFCFTFCSSLVCSCVSFVPWLI